MSSALDHIAEHGLSAKGAPVIVGLIRTISSRFGMAVSKKAAAQIVPVLGAVGGAAVNLVFMSHYQEMARGHFLVRRLERQYGAAVIKREYQRLCLPQHQVTASSGRGKERQPPTKRPREI